MILDRLVEKKDIMIYADQRIIRLKINANELNEKLRNSNISNKEKKVLMRGKNKIIGRIKELATLRYVISNGILREKAKEYWDNNYRDLHSSEGKANNGSLFLVCLFGL